MTDNLHPAIRHEPIATLYRDRPPTAFGAECRVLGAILAGRLDLAEAVAVLDRDHFADPIHGVIFAAMGDGPEPGRSIEEMHEHFASTGELDEVGGTAYLLQLAAMADVEDADTGATGVMDRSVVEADLAAIVNTWQARCAWIRQGVG